jgi:GrpB-like predicted nucleotidyltransferase (UPF0157 family)
MTDLVNDLTNATLGLLKGTVRLSEHDRKWTFVYALIASEISTVTGLSDDRIQHVGSTSVDGLAANPILDIVIGVDHLKSVDSAVNQLVEAGFLDRGLGKAASGTSWSGSRRPTFASCTCTSWDMTHRIGGITSTSATNSEKTPC